MIQKAYENGSLFDSWSEYFRPQAWQQAFEELGVDPDFYTMRERAVTEILPWDFIDVGVTKKFLIREWNRAKEEEITPNCRQQCSGCGAGRYKGGVCLEG